MDLVHGSRCKASKYVAEDDVFSSLPENLITSILDRLPIRDAVRTGILARNWRLKWTMLSQLVFDEKFFKDILGAQGTNSYDLRKVITFLLQLKGSIMKFTLHRPKDMVFDVEDINQWFLFLSTKGIKDVTLINMHETSLKLPAHLFSCLELKRLKIRKSCFHPPLSFRGFPSLLNLQLHWVRFESYKFLELVTCCPSLEVLGIRLHGLFSKVKPVEIVKLENLKVLTIPLFNLDARTLTSSTIFQLVGSFSKLRELNLGFNMCRLLAEAGARNSVDTTFPCLKTLRFIPIDCNKDIEISYILKMICCSPKLQTLKIISASEKDLPPLALYSSDLDDYKMGQLQLRSVVFACSKGSEHEVHLIKSLLAFSPLQKKISIGLDSSLVAGGADGMLQFSEKLFKLYRASPLAEIDVFYFSNRDSFSFQSYFK